MVVWKGVLPKSLALTSRAPVPYKATTSPFLLGLSCDVIIQAEELYYPFSKRMDEDVSSLGGKDPGASQKPQSGQSPEDPEVTEE